MLISRLFSISLPWILGTTPVLAQTYPILSSEPPSQTQQYDQDGNDTEAIRLWNQALQNPNLTLDQKTQLYANLAEAYGKQGQWQNAETALNTGFQFLKTLSPTPINQSLQAKLLTTKSFILSEQGQWDAALKPLQEAQHLYASLQDQTGLLHIQLNQSQILIRQGNLQPALTILTAAQTTMENQPHSILKAAINLELGTVQRLLGEYSEAQKSLQHSEHLFAELNTPFNRTTALMALGDNARDQLPRLNQRFRSIQEQIALVPPNSRGSSDMVTRSAEVATQRQETSERALSFYDQASEIAPTPTLRLQALTQKFWVALETQTARQIPNWTQVELLRQTIQNQLPQLPLTLTSLYIRLNLVDGLFTLQQYSDSVAMPSVAQLLAKIVQDAKSLGDERTEAQALGKLGLLYEQQQQWTDAQKLTFQALNLAQVHPDIAYPLYWQLGRIQAAQGKTDAAIASYTQSIRLLESLRSDLTAASPDIRYAFRDAVEPIYRQLVSLLLSTDTAQHPQSQNLIQARNLIESLQLAELVNFFQVNCDISQITNIDNLDPTSAVIYPIILSDRLEVIVKLPGQPLEHYASPLRAARLTSMAILLQKSLADNNFSQRYLTLSQELYNAIIRPLEPSLTEHHIHNLVFVLDGPLRNLPMSVLHDGKQFLIEKYAVALTPGLQLFQSQSLQKIQLHALVGGLTEARNNFAALPNVQSEMNTIEKQIPSQVLLNQTFLKKSLSDKIENDSFPIIHLATHGQFGSTAQDTFILTWDGRLEVNELSTLLQKGNAGDKAIQLLILSACQTALGDDRAALGLAGIAVRSGARSTIASLWYISDQATSELMGKLYQVLHDQTTTKAEALRQAQLELLHSKDYADPYYWAPFVLVGNWL